MRHRHYLLVAAAAPLFFAFVFIRVLFGTYPTYADADIYACVALAIALVAAWTALEIASRVLDSRAMRCSCGYSLRGVKCPECGKAVGDPAGR